MRHWLIVAAVLFSACSRGGGPAQRVEEAERLLRLERFNDEIALVEAAAPQVESSGDTALIWRFRLLRASGLMGQRKAAETLQFLARYGEPPSGDALRDTRTRLLLLRVQANQTAEADEALVQALLGRARTEAEASGSPLLLAELRLRSAVVAEQKRAFPLRSKPPGKPSKPLPAWETGAWKRGLRSVRA